MLLILIGMLAAPARPDSLASVSSPRIALSIPDTAIAYGVQAVILPVYLDNPIDTIAGCEFHVVIDDNPYIRFAQGKANETGVTRMVDTSGTIVAGWEWMGVNYDKTRPNDLKVALLADWPNEAITPPLMPQKGGLLARLGFEVDEAFAIGNNRVNIRIVTDKTGFSDIRGYSIGVVTSLERECVKYVGDSCQVWKTERIGRLDTTAVHLSSGSITASGDDGSGGD